MERAELRFLEEIPIDERHTLHQLLGRFQAVRDGLPELVKNSKDQYARRGVADAERRQIIVLADVERRRLGVLDFAGAAAEDFGHWLVWSNPDASRTGAAPEIEGRHGNGGKGFMVRGSTERAALESVVDGARTRMGFQNDRAAVRYYPGYYVEDGVEVRDQPIADAAGYLSRALEGLGASLGGLPEAARQAFEARQAFTLARVDGVRDWTELSLSAVRARADDLAADLVAHAQVALSVETCRIWVVIDGRVAAGPLERVLPQPLDGFERARTVRVPDALTDPETGDPVATGSDAPSRSLTLRTSARSLRMPGKRPLNVIRVRDARNVVASWSVADLHPQAQSAYVFGELRVPALGAGHLAGADRTVLADTALVRALRAWVAERIAALCADIQRAMAEDYDATDRRRVNRELRRFRRLMSGFLDELRAGRPLPHAGPDVDEDDTDDSGLTTGPDKEGAPASPEAELGADADADADADAADLDGPLSPLEAAREAVRRAASGPSGASGAHVVAVELEPDRDAVVVAAGTTVPLVVRVIEETASGARRVARGVEVVGHLEGDADAIAFRPDGAALIAHGPGRARLRVEEPGSGKVSEPVEVEALDCHGLSLAGAPQRVLRQGERVALTAVFDTADGPRDDLLVEAWLDEPERGRVDRRARLTAGRYPGDLTVLVRYAPEEGAVGSVTVTVGEEIELERPRRRLDGSGVPYILVCGTPAPGMGAFPKAQRTVQGGAHEPTIIDFEPQFEHVIWINPASEESVRVREGRGGRRGVAGIGTKPYLRFLALKCFEVLKRLYVRQRVADRRISEAEFRRLFAQAEMACAPFIDDAYHIAKALAQR